MSLRTGRVGVVVDIQQCGAVRAVIARARELRMTTSDGARWFIGGHFRAAEQPADVVEAATEAALGDGASATSAADVDAAVGGARSALPGWRSTPPQERA